MGLAAELKAAAKDSGFALAGVAPAADADGFARFETWLDLGYHGEMDYLARLRAQHRHPRGVFENVRSVLMVGLEYSLLDLSPSPGRVAAYAARPDYHRVIWDKLNDLAAWLAVRSPGTTSFGVADTAPLLERDFARRAGLGWFGKNTLLINKYRGSFFFLGALLTDADLESDPPHAASHCGTCTACLDACPMQAFPEPGVLDARKCISYLTIELRGPIPEELRPGVGDWLYGCDVCQDVCPWNRDAGSRDVPFPADPGLATLDPVEILGLTEAAFRTRFKGTVFFRARRTGLLRNAAIVLGNVGDAACLPVLEVAATDRDDVIADAARWAITRIRFRTPL